MISSMKQRKKLCLTFEKDFIRKVSDWITENICYNCIPKTTFKFTQVPTFSALREMHMAMGAERLVLAIITSHQILKRRLSVPYDNCVGVPISRLLTVGSTPTIQCYCSTNNCSPWVIIFHYLDIFHEVVVLQKSKILI